MFYFISFVLLNKVVHHYFNPDIVYFLLASYGNCSTALGR